jgi:HEAT repeat protein
VQPCRIDSTQAYIDARTVLRQAAEDSGDEEARLAAMHAMSEVMPADAGGVLKQALDDPKERVRFPAAMAIGDIRYAPALPVLQEKARMYTGERDKRVYCAVLYALHRLGDDTRMGDLAQFLFDGDEEVRAFAAQVMGKVGNPTAVPLLKNALMDEKKEKPKYNITEAMALLGDAGAQARLEAFARGGFEDIQIQLEAIPALGREYSPNTMAILQDLMEEGHKSPQVRVRAAGVMARLGQVTDEAYDLCARAAAHPDRFQIEQVTPDRTLAGSQVASLEQLAAISLGWMNRPDTLCVLHPLLRSPKALTRVAAAMSILRLGGGDRRAASASPAAGGESPAPEAATQPTVTTRPPALRTSGAKD